MTTVEQALQDARKWWKPGLKEAQTRKFTIDPVLRALDWPDDPGLINVEESVESGSVDYALYAHGKSRQKYPSLYIEAKRPGEDTDGVVQAVDYAHENGGVPLVLVTDGKNWHFYLTHEPGSKKDNYAKRRALTLKLDDEHIAELLPTVLGRGAVADGTAMAKLEELHGYEMAKGEFGPAWLRLCKSQDFAESVAELLTAELERFDIEPSHDDALAFVQDRLRGEPVHTGNNADGDDSKPPSPSGKVKVILTLDGKETEYHGRATAVRGLLEWDRPDLGLLSELAKTPYAVKQAARPQRRNGTPNRSWQKNGDYWVHTQLGRSALQAFIGHYNTVTGKSVVCTEQN